MKKKLQFLFSLVVMMLVATVARAQIYIETDLTSQFSALTNAANWTTYAGNAAGYTAVNFCPKVTVNGLGEKQVCEYYHNPGCDYTGEVLYQTVTGLAPGTYKIELYGAAAFTFGRGFGSEAFTGDLTTPTNSNYEAGDKIEPSDEVKTGVTLYAEAEGVTYGGEIPIYYATEFPEGAATVTLNDVVVGSSGKIKIGMSKTSKSTNWHVIQLKSVIATVDAEVLLSNAITAANAALEDAQYAAITGDERTALSTAISENSSPEATGTAYEAAVNAINAALTTFTDALSSYKPYADAKALVNFEAWPYADAAKKSAVEDAMSVDPTSAEDAATKATALLKAYRQYVESNAAAASVVGAVDMTDLITNPASADGINGWTVVKGEGSGGNIDVKNNEPWTDGSDNATHNYFDGGNWGASAWDVSFEQEVNLEAGKYLLTTIARASGDVTFTLYAGGEEVAIPAIGAAGGVFNRGWNDQFIVFDVAEAGAVKIGVKGVTNVIHNWMSFSNFRLVQLEAPKEAKLADLDKSLYHLWTGYDAEATIADPDNANCDYVLNSETGCAYGNSNINAGTATQFADLGDWDYLTIVAASGAPRLFFNQNDANNILVYANDENYVVSNEDGVIIYDLAKFKADKGIAHLNAIKASAYNTQVNIEEMKLATVEPYIPAPKYDITIAAGIENGSVAVKGGAKKAAEGAEVTLEATPDGIYELDAYSVTYVDGEETKDVEVSEGGVFVMPAFPVTVSATFKESAAPIEPDAWYVEDNFRVVDYKGVEDGGRIEKDGDGKDIRMIPRFEVENKTTGNGSIVVTTGNNAGDDYWSQFWFKVSDEPMTTASTPLALTFRIRADRAQTIATQGHGVGWDYNTASNGYLGFGKIDVTTEWKKVVLKVEAGNGHPENFVSVVLNLSEKGGTSNNFYIDDVKVEEGFKADWYYAQEIRAKDYSDQSATYSDSDTPHPLAPFVADEEGGYVQVISNANPSQPYNSQIWIQIPDEFVGQTTKMTMEVQADMVVSAPESYQATATGKGWGANAAPSASAKLEITEADKWITITRILNTENVKSNAGAPYSSRQVDQYCLDLSNDPAAITYKFRNIKFEVAYEDWWENNMITLAGSTDKVPFTPGAGEEGGYVQVAPTSDTQILFELPETMQAKKVVVSMTVKASAEGSAAAESGDGIDFTTEWNDVSAVFDPVKAGSTKYTLNLAAGTTYYFDNLAFELAPVEYEEPDLAETEKWYQDLAAQGIKFISHAEPAYSLGGEDKPMRYVKGDGPEGDYMEFVGKSGCSNRWESQAFIDLASVDEPLPDGTEVTIMMKIKANAATTCDTQAQNQAVGYLRMNLFDQVPFTTGWTTYSCTKVLDKISTSNNGDQPVTRISIDIGSAESYTCQFDDVVITITKPIDPSNFEWTETITNGEIAEGGDMSEFIVKDPDENFTQAEQRDKFGASGEEGDFGIRVKTEDVAADAPAHSYQFFVRLPYALPAGTKYWVNFDYKYNDQEKALAVSTQAQEEPGDYLGNMFGNVSFTSDYTSFEKAGEVTEDQAGMRSIAFNLSGNQEGKIFRFDNISVKVLAEDVDALTAYTADWDAVSAAKEPLKDAIKAGNAIVEEEGFAEKYTAESAKALTDALALGATANIKIAAALADADTKGASIQAMENATKDINDAIAGLTISEDYYIPMPDLTENFVKVPETPAVGFGNTAKESGEYDGDAYTNYIATETSIAFKMLNEDVTGCDKIYIYLAQPLKAGWNIAFWGVEGVEGVKALEAGTEVIEFDLTEELGGVSAVKEENGKTLLKEITLIYLWGAQTPLEAKVYGVYKHLTDEAVGIAEVDDDATETKARKYIENGQIVIVKDGKKYNAAGVEIE